MSQDPQLAETLVTLADTLVDDFDITELLQRLVDDSVRLLSSGEAGLLLSDASGRLQVLASTSERTRLLELYQLQADSGPCLDAFSSGHQVVVPDLAAAQERWPQFTSAARGAGYASVHALPMRLRSGTIGAMGLFSDRQETLTPDKLALAQALADVATIAILQHRALLRSEVRSEQLQIALNSRVLIEQAKGVLAERSSIDMDEAFNRLRRYARSHSERLVDTARGVVEGSVEPGASTGTVGVAEPRS